MPLPARPRSIPALAVLLVVSSASALMAAAALPSVPSRPPRADTPLSNDQVQQLKDWIAAGAP